MEHLLKKVVKFLYEPEDRSRRVGNRLVRVEAVSCKNNEVYLSGFDLEKDRLEPNAAFRNYKLSRIRDGKILILND